MFFCTINDSIEAATHITLSYENRYFLFEFNITNSHLITITRNHHFYSDKRESITKQICSECTCKKFYLRQSQISHVADFRPNYVFDGDATRRDLLKCRNSCLEVSCKKGVLRNFANARKNTCARVSLFNKHSLRPATLLNRNSDTSVFL